MQYRVICGGRHGWIAQIIWSVAVSVRIVLIVDVGRPSPPLTVPSLAGGSELYKKFSVFYWGMRPLIFIVIIERPVLVLFS